MSSTKPKKSRNGIMYQMYDAEPIPASIDASRIMDALSKFIFDTSVPAKNRLIHVFVQEVGWVELSDNGPMTNLEDGSELSEKQQKQVRSFMRKHFR